MLSIDIICFLSYNNIMKIFQDFEKLKLEFRNYLSDKNEPLFERWQAFLQANDGFLDAREYVEYPNVFRDIFNAYFEDQGSQCYWYNDILDNIFTSKGSINMRLFPHATEADVVDGIEQLLSEGFNRIYLNI